MTRHCGLDKYFEENSDRYFSVSSLVSGLRRWQKKTRRNLKIKNSFGYPS